MSILNWWNHQPQYVGEQQQIVQPDKYKLVEKEKVIELQQATTKVFFKDKKPISVKTVGRINLHTIIVDLKEDEGVNRHSKNNCDKNIAKRRWYTFSSPRVYFFEPNYNNNQLYSIQDDCTKEIHHFYLDSVLKVSTKFKVIEKKTIIVDELVKI